MTLTAILPYFGAKRTLAGQIVESIGPHSVYWEPFCGSLAVLLSKPVARMETVCDLHGDVVNLARVLQRRESAEELYGLLYPMIPCQELHAEARGRVNANPPDLESQPDVGRALDFFVASWLGRNGTTGCRQKSGNNFAVRYTSNGGSPGPRWRSSVEMIPEWHERLRSVLVLNTDGIEACGRIEDKPGTAIYADPPYLVKGAAYLHDFEADDHKRLAAALGRFRRTRVVVSYYAHPDLEVLYPGWERIDVATAKALAVSAGRVSGLTVRAPELLLVNRTEG